MPSIVINGERVNVPTNFRDMSSTEQQQWYSNYQQSKATASSGSGVLGGAPKGVSTSPSKQALSPGAQNLVDRGVPEEEAIRAAGEDSQDFYQTNNEIFDPLSLGEVSKMDMAWNELTAQEQQKLVDSIPDNVAQILGFAEGFLPVSLVWAIGAFGTDQMAAQVKHAIQKKGTTGRTVGTVASLIAVVGILRKVAVLGLDALLKGAREAARKKSKDINKFIDDATKKAEDATENVGGILKEKGLTVEAADAASPHITQGKFWQEQAKIADNFSKDTRETWRKFGLQNARDNAKAAWRKLPDGPFKELLEKESGDLFSNKWTLDIDPERWPDTFIKDIIAEPLKNFIKNVGTNAPQIAIETVAGGMGGFIAEMALAYKSNRFDGKSVEESKANALKYAKDRAPEDFAAAVLDVLGPKWAADALRAWISISDVDTATGGIRTEGSEGIPGPTEAITGAITGLNQGGLLSMKDVKSNMSKKQPMPKKVRGGLLGQVGKFNEGGEVNTNVVERGDRYRAALGDFFSKTFDSKQGIHPDVKDTLRTVAELTPILGDALAAEEIVRELGKDPINWALVGALGGATLIGVVPGIGDAAAAAIKAGARKGLKAVEGGAEILSRLEVDTDAVGALGGNIRLKPKGSGRKKAIETIYVQDPNTGAIQEMTGTREQLAKKLGKSESALKKSRGRDTMGFQWSKDPDGFKEFKSGKAKVKEDRLDAENIDFTRDQRTSLPRSLDPEDRDMLEDLVDQELEISMNQHWDQLVKDSPWGENDPKISQYFESVENVEAIAAKAWPSILQKLKNSNWIQGQDNETYNKIVKWAKNRTRQVFDKVQDTDPTGNRSRRLVRDNEELDRELSQVLNMDTSGGSGAIDASSLETVVIPGVERRNVLRGRGQRWSDIEKLDLEAKADRYSIDLDDDFVDPLDPDRFFNKGGLLKKRKKQTNKKVRGGVLMR